MRAGTPIAFWKSEGNQALQARSGIGPCTARARVGRHCGGGVIQLAFIRGGKGTRGSLLGMAGREHTYRQRQLKIDFQGGR